MIDQWIREIGSGMIGAIINPVLYVAILMSIIAGLVRVKRERNDLRVGVQSWMLELKSLFSWGLLIGLLASIALVAVGVQVPIAWVIVVSMLMMLGALTMQFRVLSAALIIPAAGLIMLLLPYLPWNLSILSGYETIQYSALGVTSVVMGILLFAEGLLIKWNASKKSSPRFIKTPRGLKAGAFLTKRMWLVPLFLLIPSGALGEMAGWWPVMTIGTTTWSLIIVPFILGFQLTVVHDVPAPVIRQASKGIIWLGAFVTALAAAGWWAPYIWIAAFAIAFFGRIYLALKIRAVCRQSGYHFINRDRGIIIVDVLPGTPAEQMGLFCGEIVQKINGELVKDEGEFYRALQKNRAHCKLEVVGHNGEIRYVQRALHEGQHHQLGIIMVEDRMRQYESDSA
ncbi:PDZ domain-containing protein [Jeotgalibacillus soli]|uniref:PDZ domain-containing protein n=1 Tax=Jeotgalibacillus soli TaxID=889306 RepID=A0A0C2S7H1_9BACL|nr:PDZ domain-containing protein [Jeotgalibacillus soli]KIL49964.1 hypothetical protein KP78_14320 [Jeotgalibacillus soli]